VLPLASCSHSPARFWWRSSLCHNHAVANPEHVRLVAQGWQATWSRLRPGSKFEPLDLTGANLSGMDLSWTHLGGADLTGANLDEAQLRDAFMTNARLDRASLQGTVGKAVLNDARFVGATIRANLVESELYRADFTNADLSQSNLSWCKMRRSILNGANLFRTQFQEAELPYASLRGAKCERMQLVNTVLAGADLSGAIGLESVDFMGPAVIDHETILRSGELPRSFLEGCGLPDEVIEFYESQAGAIRYYSCFISYSSLDQEFANRLYADLQQNGIRCWLATEDLRIGDRLRPTIGEAIRLHDKLLVVLSEHSVESAWVESEVEAAMERERREKTTILFPVRLDDAVMETGQAWAEEVRRTRHIGDFRNWKSYDSYRRSFERLVRDLKR
jgi:uncharacterized protein YjbI with pentapeptide repeats